MALGLKVTPSSVVHSSVTHYIQGLPHELQERIYQELWQGLAQEKSQRVTVEHLCRELHKRKVTQINQRIRFHGIKGIFYHCFRYSSFTSKDALILLERYPEWQQDEMSRYINYLSFWRRIIPVRNIQFPSET